MNKILNKNIRLFYAINFFDALVFSIPIWLIFFTVYLNFSIWTAIFINVFAWFIAFIFEILSWSWADRFWRKKIYLIWSFLAIIWWSFYLWADKIYLFIISSILIWISIAITSGNLEALIHDHLDENESVKKYDSIQANQYIYLFVWKAIAALFWWYIYIISPTLPFYLNALSMVIVFILILFLHEPKQKKSEYNSDFIHIKEWFNFLWNNKKYLYFILLWGFIFSWFWNIFRFSYQEYLKEIWFHIREYWIIYFFISLFSAFWSYLVKKLQFKYSSFNLLRLINIILLFSSLLFIYFNSIFWIIPIFILSIIFWFIMIIWNNYLIKNSPKTHKSTILSIFSFTISLWYFIFSSISWLFIDIFNLTTVYLYIPIFLAIIISIDFIYFRKKYY
jgi:MFS family permease